MLAHLKKSRKHSIMKLPDKRQCPCMTLKFSPKPEIGMMQEKSPNNQEQRRKSRIIDTFLSQTYLQYYWVKNMSLQYARKCLNCLMNEKIVLLQTMNCLI